MKLSARYYGPYKIIQKIGTVAYWLELPAGCQLHLVFHVSQLKRRIGPAVTSQLQPPICDDEGRVLIQPITNLQHSMVKVDNGAQVKVLILWANLGRDEASWDDWGGGGRTLRADFWSLSHNNDLEGKACL
ncbi:uncharacterized protein [Nicotiana tomentosiformis]|uniref:uncharacterized protein n=1 Tax=Nicotiana tomentosiformis TaxID=4098 RepID=UPI00388CD603